MGVRFAIHIEPDENGWPTIDGLSYPVPGATPDEGDYELVPLVWTQAEIDAARNAPNELVELAAEGSP